MTTIVVRMYDELQGPVVVESLPADPGVDPDLTGHVVAREFGVKDPGHYYFYEVTSD